MEFRQVLSDKSDRISALEKQNTALLQEVNQLKQMPVTDGQTHHHEAAAGGQVSEEKVSEPFRKVLSVPTLMRLLCPPLKQTIHSPLTSPASYPFSTLFTLTTLLATSPQHPQAFYSLTPTKFKCSHLAKQNDSLMVSVAYIMTK